MDTNEKLLVGGLVSLGAILLILLIIFGPFVLIWAISTIWHVPAVYTFKTWLAAEIFVLWLKSSSTKS